LDFDGDTLALYAVHDYYALKEATEKAYLGNDVFYDHANEFLSLVRHEALYAAFILTKDFGNIDESMILEIDNLSDLIEDIEHYNNPRSCVIFNNQRYSYGICLFNKWCGFDNIEINKLVNKSNNNFLSGKIWELTNDATLFYKQMNHLEKNLFFYISINDCFSPTINIKEMIGMSLQVRELADKIPDNIDVGYLVNQALIKRCLEEFGQKETTLLNLFKSGSRFSEKQLARSVVNIGFVANAENKIQPMAFNTNLLAGLSEREFFESSSGTRKG